MFKLLFFFVLPFLCQTAHFQGGSITYKIINTTNSTALIMITQTYIYVYPSIYCNNSYIINQSPKLAMTGRGENGKYLNCTANCTTAGGYVSIPLDPYCTDYSSAMSITIGQRSDLVNISIGAYFVVAFINNNWRPLTLPPGNSAAKSWSVACTIDLQLRDNGKLNNPPVAAIISPMYIPVGIQQVIFIPTIDADNDQVRCRFASNASNECADVCPPASLPNGTVILSNCTLYITGTNINDWYAVAIMIEDFVNSTSTTPLSSVPVQFLINVRGVSNCSTRPFLTGPVSQTGDCVGIQVGQTYIIELTAKNFCPNSTTIQDIATLSFPVLIKTPIVQNTTSLWSVTLTWVPTASSVGSQILCAVAIDSANVQSNQYCLTFTVAQDTVPTCPGEIEATTQNSMSTLQEVTTYTTSESLTNAIDTTSTVVQQTTYLSSTSFALETTSSFEISLSTTMSLTSILSSTMLTQSTYIDTTYSSTPSSSSATIPELWIIALISALALILICLCLCCCYHCCPLCCPLKRSSDKEYPLQNNAILPPIYTYMICNSSENSSNDTADPLSISRHSDDIHLTIFSNPKEKNKPHYTLALNRSPRVAPASPSLASLSSRTTTSETHFFSKSSGQ